MQIPQKVKKRTTIPSSNSTLGYLSKENRNTNSKRKMNPYVYCNIVYNRQDMEATIDRWIDRWIKKIYIHNGILLSHKKNEILPFVIIHMDLENIVFCEMSDRERQILYDFIICGI